MQVQHTKEQIEALSSMASVQKTSISELVRRAVDRLLADERRGSLLSCRLGWGFGPSRSSPKLVCRIRD
jgi:hypothetical protein